MLQSSVTTGKKEGKREKRARIVYLNFTIKFGFHNIFTFRSFDGAPASKFACMSAHVCVCVCVCSFVIFLIFFWSGCLLGLWVVTLSPAPLSLDISCRKPAGAYKSWEGRGCSNSCMLSKVFRIEPFWRQVKTNCLYIFIKAAAAAAAAAKNVRH